MNTVLNIMQMHNSAFEALRYSNVKNPRFSSKSGDKNRYLSPDHGIRYENPVFCMPRNTLILGSS